MREPPKRLSANLTRLRRGLGRYRTLLAVAALIVLSLIYIFIFHKSLNELISVALPNAVAALFVFLAVYALYQFIGVAPTDEIATLLDSHRDQFTAHVANELEELDGEIRRLKIPRPRGIIDFFPHWNEMTGEDWQDVLDRAEHIDVVMNWCDSWFEANARLFRRLLSNGARVDLFLPDPGLSGNKLESSDRDRVDRLAITYDMPRQTVRFKIADSVVRLVDLGASPNQITVRLLDGLTYPAVRVDENRLLISHYDQFRVGHPRAYALLLDLEESAELSAYWSEQFGLFYEVEPTPVEKLVRLRQSLGANKASS